MRSISEIHSMKKIKKFLGVCLIMLSVSSCSGKTGSNEIINSDLDNMNENLELATFGAGCFWCVEAIFQSLEGVQKVESGYAGGNIKNPSYREVCTGRTGHAEVIQLTFDPNIISFAELLEVFWETHDPTTLNQQGADKGTQYRSAIFYHSEEQKKIAEASLEAAEESRLWPNKIVTEISPISNYYPAEDYHQDYYNNNKEQQYCSVVITPKMDKFKKRFRDKLKEGVVSK